MVAWTPGLFSLLCEEVLLPEPADFLLSPLALAGPNVRTFVAWPWLLDFGFDRPETWKEENVEEDKIKTHLSSSSLFLKCESNNWSKRVTVLCQTGVGYMVVITEGTFDTSYENLY